MQPDSSIESDLFQGLLTQFQKHNTVPADCSLAFVEGNRRSLQTFHSLPFPPPSRSQAPAWERPSPELPAWLSVPRAGKLEALPSGMTKRELGHEGRRELGHEEKRKSCHDGYFRSCTFLIERVSAARCAAETRTIGRSAKCSCQWCKI